MTNFVHIGKYRLGSRVLVAPMSGVTDLPFRRVLQRFNPGLVVSEMVADEYLIRGEQEPLARMSGAGEIDPLVIQLIGREPVLMAKAAQMAEAAGADIIDINMGCPSRKVTHGLAGSALMRDAEKAIHIIGSVIDAVSVPVTLKMRLGWDKTHINGAHIAKAAEDYGVQMIVVHGRTRAQFYKGHADWAAIKPIRDAVSIPVFANGDIHDAKTAKVALERSQCAGIMIGRSLIGAPWKINDIRHYVDELDTPQGLSPAQKLGIIKTHYRDVLDFYGEHKGLRVARKHLAGYVDHSPLALSGQDVSTLRREICQLTEPERVIESMKALYLTPIYQKVGAA